MAPQPSTREIAEEFSKRGAFQAIRHYVDIGVISRAAAAEWTAMVFDLFLLKAREAQNEVRKIDAVIQRVSNVSATGAKRRPFDPNDPAVHNLAREILTFDDWVMSLYETDLTMIWYGAPERANAKPMEMAKSMDALRQKRLAELDFKLKAPELFRRG